MNYFTLPVPPLQSIVEITYYDGDNVQQTLATSVYNVVNPNGGAGHVCLADGQSWPTVYERPDAIRVEFTAGYGPAGSDIPAEVVHAAKLYAGRLYTNRGDGEHIPGQAVSPATRAIRALLSKHKWPGYIDGRG